jgi:hypothetical protein
MTAFFNLLGSQQIFVDVAVAKWCLRRDGKQSRSRAYTSWVLGLDQSQTSLGVTSLLRASCPFQALLTRGVQIWVTFGPPPGQSSISTTNSTNWPEWYPFKTLADLWQGQTGGPGMKKMPFCRSYFLLCFFSPPPSLPPPPHPLPSSWFYLSQIGLNVQAYIWVTSW